MPSSVVISLGVEVLFILATLLFLIHPKKLFRGSVPKMKTFWSAIGLFLFSLTFCWSIILGIILAMNDMSLRF